MHFLQIFHLFLKCVIYSTTLESVCQDFFQTFFKKFFELFVNLQSRNQPVLYPLFTLFLTEKPLSFSSLSCDSSNILSYLQAVVKTFSNFFLKFFEFSLNFDSGIQSSEHSFSTLIFLENPHFIGFFAALSRQLVYNITTVPKCQHLFSDFLNFFFKKFLHTKYSLLNNL